MAMTQENQQCSRNKRRRAWIMTGSFPRVAKTGSLPKVYSVARTKYLAADSVQFCKEGKERGTKWAN